MIIRVDETGEGRDNPVSYFTVIAFQYGYFEVAHLLLYRAEQKVSEWLRNTAVSVFYSDYNKEFPYNEHMIIVYI